MAIEKLNFKIKGMSKDASVSIEDTLHAYDIKNFRFTATDDTTLMSLVNEKGTSEIALYTWSNDTWTVATILGTIIGSAVLNDLIVLFTHYVNGNTITDYIYKIKEYTASNVTYMRLYTLYSGDLDFDVAHPLETLPLYETEDILKVYWVDGINQPRFINIAVDTTYSSNKNFNFLPAVGCTALLSWTRTYGSGSFPACALLYFISFSNNNGQETSIITSTPLIFTTFNGRAGSPEETIPCTYNITIYNCGDDTLNTFDKVNLYKMIRTSESGTPIVTKIAEVPTSDILENQYRRAIILDSNTTGETIDSTALLYKGAANFIASTLSSKDNTLFLGNLKNSDINVDDITFPSTGISISPSYRSTGIPYYNSSILYHYEAELLVNSNLKLRYMRKNNWYRLGVLCQDLYGKWSNPIFIIDKRATARPTFLNASNKIAVPFYTLTLTEDSTNQVLDTLYTRGFRRIRPVMVLPNVAKRNVIALGITCPTMFTPEYRAANAPFALASWVFRPYPVLSGDSGEGYNPVLGSENIFAEGRNMHAAGASGFGNGEFQYMDFGVTGTTPNLGDYTNCYAIDSILSGDKKNFYFVDASIITFHSPDVEALNDNLIANTSEIYTVGYNYINSSSAYTYNTAKSITSGDSINPLHRLLNSKTLNPAYSFTTNIGLSHACLRFYSTDLMVTYPWNSQYYIKTDAHESEIAKNITSNLRVSLEFLFLDSEVSNNLSDAKVSDSSGVTISKLLNASYMSSYAFDKLVYQSNIDLLQSPLTNYHPYYGYAINPLYNFYFLSALSTTLSNPVRIKYNSTKHLVLGLSNTSNGETSTLPYPYITSSPNNNIEPTNTVVPFWLTSGYPDLSSTVQVSASSYGATSLFWITELRRNFSSGAEVFGDSTNKFAMNLLEWIPAGDAVTIPNAGVSSIDLEITEGDTMFDRYDCLKTYPASSEDTNLVVDIVSFMCESYVNLDGRYDKNRGLTDNTIIDNTNFNLFNDTYNNINNYFTYRIPSYTEPAEKKYPNCITWSLTKNAGEDIDNWTNVSLASILELDGDRGLITSLLRLNNELIAFLEKGISQILYNESVLISTELGVPILIANSGKVNGKRYLSSSLGCYNKWSITLTPEGIYFVDANTRDIYRLSGNQLINLSLTKGFHVWTSLNLSSLKVWDPSNWNNGIVYYDAITRDVLFVTNALCLAYNELLGEFSSFYDYENITSLTNVEGRSFVTKGTKLYALREGYYNSFFANIKPYWIEYIANAKATLNKIFNTVEFRGDSFKLNISTYELDYKAPFNKIQVYNEYLNTGEVSLTNYRSSAGKQLPLHSNLRLKFRVWRALIPRDSGNRDRISNMWSYIKLKNSTPGTNKVILYDTDITYFI